MQQSLHSGAKHISYPEKEYKSDPNNYYKSWFVSINKTMFYNRKKSFLNFTDVRIQHP